MKLLFLQIQILLLRLLLTIIQILLLLVIIIITNAKRICKIVDYAVPADHRIKLKLKKYGW